MIRVIFDIYRFAKDFDEEARSYFYRLAKALEKTDKVEIILAGIHGQEDMLHSEANKYIAEKEILRYQPLNKMELFPYRDNYERKPLERVANRLWRLSLSQVEKLISTNRSRNYFGAEADIFHHADSFSPDVAMPKVATVQNFKWLLEPEKMPKDKVEQSHANFESWLENAEAFTVFSQHTKNEMMKFYQIPDEKITVIYPGINENFYKDSKNDKIAATFDKLGISGKPYFVCYSPIDLSKNLSSIIKAFSELKKSDKYKEHQLLLIGKNRFRHGDIIRKAERSPASNAIHFCNGLDSDTIRQLLNNAVCAVYTSQQEGFGMPAVEAMACGCPLVSSDSAALPEILGKHAVYVNAAKIEDIAVGMDKLASDKSLRENLSSGGLEWVKRYSYERAAEQTLEVYRSVIRTMTGERPLFEKIKRTAKDTVNEISVRRSRCPRCESLKHHTEYRFNKELFKHCQIHACDNCGLVYTWPVPSKEELEEYYNKYYKITGSTIQELEENKQYEHIYDTHLNRQRELSFITPYAKKGGKMLDIGCSWGFMMVQARDMGYEVYGTELATVYSEFGRKNLDLEIRIGELEHCNWEDESFDFLTLSHSFEHFRKPWDSVKELARVLKPGGHMLIIVPNYDSYLRKKLGEEWIWISPLDHYYHLSKDSLENMLAPHFDIEEWRSEEGHYGYEAISKFLSKEEQKDRFDRIEGSELIVIARKKA